MLLFPTRNRESLKNVIKELSDDIGEEEFLAAFETATRDGDHDFLFVDFHPKIKGRRFRKNFDEYIIPPTDNGGRGGDDGAVKAEGDPGRPSDGHVPAGRPRAG